MKKFKIYASKIEYEEDNEDQLEEKHPVLFLIEI